MKLYKLNSILKFLLLGLKNEELVQILILIPFFSLVDILL